MPASSARAATSMLHVQGALRLLGIGAALGLLVPVMVEVQAAGMFVLYAVWQAGFAAGLAKVEQRTWTRELAMP